MLIGLKTYKNPEGIARLLKGDVLQEHSVVYQPTMCVILCRVRSYYHKYRIEWKPFTNAWSVCSIHGGAILLGFVCQAHGGSYDEQPRQKHVGAGGGVG